MFELKGLKRTIALIIAKNQTRVRESQDEREFEPKLCLKNSRRILVCMPFEYDEFKAALPFINQVADRFPQSRMTAVVPESFRNWLDRKSLTAVIHLKPDDANFLKLPGKNLRDRLIQKAYDMAIDLNSDENLFSSILCAVCGAKVRVGFDREECGMFFNYLIIPRDSQDMQAKYSALMNYLCNS